MKYVYNYEDSMQQCEKLLRRNFAKLKFLKHQVPCSSESFEMEDAYIIMKKYLNFAQENILLLKSEYNDLIQHYSSVFQNNCTKEFVNYLNCQEALRLKFIEIIDECKRLNSCLNDLYDSPVETMTGNSISSIYAFSKTSNTSHDL